MAKAFSSLSPGTGTAAAAGTSRGAAPPPASTDTVGHQIWSKSQVFERLHNFLASPVPADFGAEAVAKRGNLYGRGEGKYSQARGRVGELFFGPTPRL